MYRRKGYKRVRQSYLVSHLEKFHKHSKIEVREKAIRSLQVRICDQLCIDKCITKSVTDDDGELDLINERDRFLKEYEPENEQSNNILENLVNGEFHIRSLYHPITEDLTDAENNTQVIKYNE